MKKIELTQKGCLFLTEYPSFEALVDSMKNGKRVELRGKNGQNNGPKSWKCGKRDPIISVWVFVSKIERYVAAGPGECIKWKITAVSFDDTLSGILNGVYSAKKTPQGIFGTLIAR